MNKPKQAVIFDGEIKAWEEIPDYWDWLLSKLPGLSDQEIIKKFPVIAERIRRKIEAKDEIVPDTEIAQGVKRTIALRGYSWINKIEGGDTE